jgi:hypothetical protein
MDEQERQSRQAILARSQEELSRAIKAHQRQVREWRDGSHNAPGKQWSLQSAYLQTQGEALTARFAALLTEDLALDRRANYATASENQ